MKPITNFIPYLFLFAVLSLHSCKSSEDVNNLTITLSGVVKQEIPVDLYINQYLDYIKDQDLSGKINGSYILSSGSFTVDLNDILQQEHFPIWKSAS